MYDVFKQHRSIKLIGLFFTVLLLSYLIHAGLSLFRSRGVSLSSLVGLYSAGVSRQIEVKDGGLGRLVSGDYSSNFSYEYSLGTFDCTSADKLKTWQIRVVDQSNLFSSFDNVYLYRQEVNQ
jgi:hypothetical protein